MSTISALDNIIPEMDVASINGKHLAPNDQIGNLPSCFFDQPRES